MKRKHLLLMLLMALIVPLAVNAQQTHTVYSNGTDKSPYVPIFGQYVDYGTKTEFIIPSGLLNPMHSEGGCYVTKMTFYLGEQASKAWNASFRVFIKNYGNNQFYNESFVGDAGATTVYNGVLNANSSTMEVVFDQNFHYDGQSHILIGFYLTEGGQYADARFLGWENSTTYTAINAFDEDGTGYNSPIRYKFTPKVTFDYFTIQTPTNVQVYSEPGLGVTISWQGNANSYNIQYENMENIFSYYNGSIYTSNSSYTFTGQEAVPLVPGMKYRYRVMARYTPELASDWSDWVTYVDCPNYLDLPLHANFDYMPVSTTNTENNLPGCWMHINNSTDPAYSNYPLIENNQSLCHSNYYPYGQYNYVRFNMPTGNNGGVDQYLIFPPVDVTSSGGVELKFWVRNVDEHSTMYNYIVGLIDNPLNLNEYDIYTRSGYNGGGFSTDYFQDTFVFTQEELQQHGNYIVIKAPAASDWPVSFCIDDIDIYPANYHCGEPVDLRAESITISSAEILWDNPETGGGEWGLKYKKASDTEWTMVYENGIASHSWVLNDLEENTMYNVAVINHCNSIDHSEWAEASFTTLAIPMPTNLAVNYQTPTSAIVTWSAGEDENQWQIAYKKASDAEWTVVPNHVDQTFYTLSSLDPDTEYQVKVRSYHGFIIGYSAWTTPVSYTTPGPCIAINDYPWTENFDSYMPSEGFLPNCWNRINTGTSYNNYPCVIGNSSHSASNCLHFFSGYIGDIADQYIVLPEMTGLAGGEISFWAKGENTYSRISIGIMTDQNDIETFSPFVSFTFTNTNYKQYTCTIPPTSEYQGNYVAFKVEKSSGSNYVGAYIDDITIDAAVPTYLCVYDIIGTEATFGWTENGTATAWQICLNDDETNLIMADSNPFRVTGLTANTTYSAKVRAYYSATKQSGWSDSYYFTTLLQDPVVVDATHPYTDNFEGTLDWVFTNGSCTNYWKHGTDANLSDGTTSGLYSGNALFIANDSDYNGGYGYDITNSGSTVYASKTFTLDAETYYYSYNWRCYGEENYDYLRVALVPASTTLTAGVFNQPSDLNHNSLPADWINLDGGSQPSLSNTWATIANKPALSNVTNSITITTPGEYKVVFIWHNGNDGGTQYPAAIDNFSLSLPCPKPTNLTYSNRTNSSVTLDWDSNGNYHAWQIAVDKEGDDMGYTIVGATATKPYVLTGLNPGTTYHVKVISQLSQGVFSSYSNEVTFTTKQNAELLEFPFTDNFDSSNSYWLMFNSTGYNKWVRGTATSNSGSYSLYVSQDNGASNTYAYNEAAMVYATKLFQFERGIYRISYNWKGNGDISDYLRAFLVPGDVELIGNATGTLPNMESWISVDGDQPLYGETSWQTASFEVAVPVDGDYMMVFAWRNNNAVDHNPPAAVDNVSIQRLGSIFATTGDWDDADNWMNGIMPTSPDDVIIRAGATIQSGTVALANNITYDNHATSPTITIADGGLLNVSGTLGSNFNNLTINEGGQVKCNNTFIGTMKKNIIGYGEGNEEDKANYYLIGTPSVVDVIALVPGGEANYPKADVYMFDGSHQGEEWRWSKWPNGPSSTVVGYNHRGFLFAYQDDFELSISSSYAAFPATNVDVDVTYLVNTSNTPFGKYNLIGNPYTCNAYLADGRDFLRMNATGDAIVLADESNGGNVIKPLEGVFIVFGAEETETSVTFTTEEPTDLVNNSMINLGLTQGRGALVDNARIRLGEGNAVRKLVFGNNSRIYFAQGNEDYAVVRSNAQGEIPVSFKASKNGIYTLSVNPENVEMNYLHLIDNKTGADIDLLQNPSYSFEAKTSDYACRFKLVFSANDENGSSTDSETFAYINDGNIIINGEGVLQIVDVMGRVKLQKEAVNHVSTSGMTPGVYVLRLINGDSIRTQKIVVR